jgi:hypothetical protein
VKIPAVPAVAAVAAVVVSAGCGGQPKPATESSAFVSRATSVAAPSTPVGRGETPSRDFVIGKWGTDGDCTLAIDLRADGTSDGPFGDWTYSDGVISFPDAPELAVNVMILDDTTMQSINDSSGKTSKMTRCP